MGAIRFVELDHQLADLGCKIDAILLALRYDQSHELVIIRYRLFKVGRFALDENGLPRLDDDKDAKLPLPARLKCLAELNTSKPKKGK